MLEKLQLDKLKEKVTEKLNDKIDLESMEKLVPLNISSKFTLSNEEENEEKSWKEQAEEQVCALFPTLSWKDRFMGCLICMASGYILSFGSFFRFQELLLGKPVPFVTSATLGNVISLSGSCFLMGPTNQMKRMFHKTRRIATTAYLSSLCVTLIVSFLKPFEGKAFVVVLLMMIQYLAVGWYCASYIPFAREGIKKCGRKLLAELMED